MKIHLANEAATQRLGELLADIVNELHSVWLAGDLGAGKTTLTRALLRAMGHEGAVKSPTFTLVEPYEINGRAVNHFDLYRLADPEELEYLGFSDYLGEALVLIEWPEKAQGYLPEPDLEIDLRHLPEGREAYFKANNPVAQQFVSNIDNLL